MAIAMPSNKRKKKTGRRTRTQRMNFVLEAGQGCHIVRIDNQCPILEWESVSMDDYDDPVPDIAIDPHGRTLTMCNMNEELTQVGYITVYETNCFGRNRYRFSAGSTTDNIGRTQSCVTFIVLCPPLTFVHLCEMDIDDVTKVQVDSDVQPWNHHPNPDDLYPQPIQGFPLQGGPFLCTQGQDGHLTHYFSGNFHAIDFRCNIGTPLLAVGDGEVIESQDHNTTLTGVAVSNLFQWNSILLKLDQPCATSTSSTSSTGSLFVEYVHVQSSRVRVGQRVKIGECIGTSGSVGFSPEPHLHFAAYRSEKPDAPTVGFRFQGKREGILYEPKAGQWYDASGRVPKGETE